MELFSGIQPSGRVHLGNYLGAIQNWVELQRKYDQPMFCIVDLHSLTSVPRLEKLKTVEERLQSQCFDLTVALLACGLDPEKCVLFRQSAVPFHSHLSWLLACRTKMYTLNLMTQYKSKAATIEETCGLFTYPVLMASDILLVGVVFFSFFLIIY